MKVMSFMYSPLNSMNEYKYRILVSKIDLSSQTISGFLFDRLSEEEKNLFETNPKALEANRELCGNTFRTFKSYRCKDVKTFTV